MTESGKPLLLVVDDDRAIRKLLARIAERAGFEVDSAKDGAEALEMLSAKLYAIAIIDLMMPRVSGYELVQKIGAMKPHPVVLVATALTNGDLANLDDTMVRRVIRKPFDIAAVAETLIETAREIVDRGRTTEDVVLPDNATVTANDATIRVDNVTIVADHVTVISDDVTTVPRSESDTPIVAAPDAIEPVPGETKLPDEAK